MVQWEVADRQKHYSKDEKHYARDESNAEKAEQHVHYLIQDGDSQSIDKAPSQPSADSEDLKVEFRPDAKIWALYLEEAEREAKERAELWRTGLDSLLIFVRLLHDLHQSDHLPYHRLVCSLASYHHSL